MISVLLVHSDGCFGIDTDQSGDLLSYSGETLMLITDEIFQAFLQCETKSHLKLSGAAGDQREFPDWERNLGEDYKRKCYRQLRANCREAECLVGVSFPQDLENSLCRLVIDC